MKSILYVEDNQANTRLMNKIIERLDDFVLYTAPTAELGLEIAREKQPSVIILDINLPGMDGYEALGKLQSFDETKNIPVMALSANAMPSDLERGAAAGFKKYLTKPINITEIESALREAIDG